MKAPKLISFYIFLLVTMLACSTITNFTSRSSSTPVPTPSKVIFEDSEFTNSCSAESTSDVARRAENGQFVMEVITSSYVGWTECTDVEYADFIMEVDASQLNGTDNNAYGIILRYGLEADDFYAFLISGDGYYAFTVDGGNRTDPGGFERAGAWRTESCSTRMRRPRVGAARAAETVSKLNRNVPFITHTQMSPSGLCVLVGNSLLGMGDGGKPERSGG